MNKNSSIQGKRLVSHRDSNLAIVYSLAALILITLVISAVNLFVK